MAHQAVISQLYAEERDLGIQLFLLGEERERQLKERLEKERLAVCSTDLPHLRPDIVDPRGRLGVFPKDRMTMVYDAYAYTAIQRTTSGYSSKKVQGRENFTVLCPTHAPGQDVQNYSRPNPYDSRLGPDMWSRVNIVDGKYVREVDGRVIHNQPRQGEPFEAIYAHFEFPELPEAPRVPR